MQDETGGITIHPIANTKLKLGQKVRITGIVGSYEGDTQLGEVQELTDVEIIDQSIQLVDPTNLSTADSMLEKYEGLLVRVQGTVQSIDAASGKIIVNDGSGDARVHIQGYIGGGESQEAVGKWVERINVGETISAIGLAAEDAEGKRIRVRNTDEVVVVAGDTPDQPGTPEEPEQPDQPGTPEEPEQPEKPGKPEQPEKPENSGTSEQPEKPENSGTSEQPEQPEGSRPVTGQALMGYLFVGLTLIGLGFIFMRKQRFMKK